MKKISASITIKILRVAFLFFLLSTSNLIAAAQVDTTSLKITIPKAGKMHHDKPKGKGWVNLLNSESDWNFEKNYWQFTDSSFHGTMGKEKEHHYSYTKKTYKDFELNVMIRMVGDSNINSGVCVRINPTN